MEVPGLGPALAVDIVVIVEVAVSAVGSGMVGDPSHDGMDY